MGSSSGNCRFPFSPRYFSIRDASAGSHRRVKADVLLERAEMNHVAVKAIGRDAIADAFGRLRQRAPDGRAELAEDPLNVFGESRNVQFDGSHSASLSVPLVDGTAYCFAAFDLGALKSRRTTTPQKTMRLRGT
jgi:hypothetical protein